LNQRLVCASVALARAAALPFELPKQLSLRDAQDRLPASVVTAAVVRRNRAPRGQGLALGVVARENGGRLDFSAFTSRAGVEPDSESCFTPSTGAGATAVAARDELLTAFGEARDEREAGQRQQGGETPGRERFRDVIGAHPDHPGLESARTLLQRSSSGT
jgi:hypothetical protein